MKYRNVPSNPLQPLQLALLAHCRANNWELSIDESVGEEDRWFAQLEGPSTFLYFEISSPQLIVELDLFLDASRTSPVVNRKELHFGNFDGNPVMVLRDDEFNDRVFVCVLSKEIASVRISVQGNDLIELTRAVRQIRIELFPDD